MNFQSGTDSDTEQSFIIDEKQKLSGSDTGATVILTHHQRLSSEEHYNDYATRAWIRSVNWILIIYLN